jgi:hypothetical protein
MHEQQMNLIENPITIPPSVSDSSLDNNNNTANDENSSHNDIGMPPYNVNVHHH